MMTNIPELKLGLVSVSRDCFPMALSVGRRDALAAAYAQVRHAAQLPGVYRERDGCGARL